MTELLYSVVSKIHWGIKRVFYSGVYTDTWEDIGDGGPTCFNEMTVEFRVIIAIIMATVQYFVRKHFNRRMNEKYKEKSKTIVELEPTLLEKIFGVISILLFLIQMFLYKFPAGKGIFLFNPCHVVLLLEAYILLTKKTQKSNEVYANFVSNIFSPWCGIFFAINVGLDGPFEKEMYWIEHFWSALVNPLILIISGRYRGRQYFDIGYRPIGFAFFSLYHRLILLPLGLLTWANLDQSLCHADPGYKMFGKYYYLMADLYVAIPSYLFAYLYLLFAEAIYFVQDLVTGRKIKKE